MAKTVLFEVVIKGQKDVEDLRARIGNLQKEMKKTKDIDVAENLAKEIAQLKFELDRAKDSALRARKEFEAQDESIGAYKRLSAQLFVARENFKQLAASEGIASKATQAARIEAEKLDRQLKKIDAATGVYGRNVGNYGSAWKNTITQIRQSVVVQRAVSTIPNAFSQIQGAIEAVSNAIEQYRTNFSASYKVQKQVEEGVKRGTEEFVNQRVQLDGLTKAATAENATKEERKAAIDALNAQFGQYSDNLLTEQSSYEEIAAFTDAANKGLIRRIALEQQQVAARELLKDATEKILAVEEVREKFGESGFNLFGVNVTPVKMVEDAAKASVDALSQVGKVGDATEKALELVSAKFKLLGLDFADAFGGENIEGKLKADAAKAAEAARKAREAEAKKAAAEAKRLAEQLQKDRIKFADEQAKFDVSFAKEQRDRSFELANELAKTIEDRYARERALAELARQKERDDRQREFDAVLAEFARQQAELVRLFGENSRELAEFRQATDARLAAIQEQNARLAELKEAEHQARLLEIEKQGQEEREKQEKEANDARLSQSSEYIAEVEQGLELELSILKEQLARRKITTEQAAEAEAQARRAALEERIAVLSSTLENETDLDDKARRDLVLRRQQLNTELAELEAQQTANVEEQSRLRQQARLNEIKEVSNAALLFIDTIAQFSDIAAERENARFEQGLTVREEAIAGLESQLQGASGLQREFLEQQLKAEREAVLRLEKEKEASDKRAAKRRKREAIAQALINGFLAITNIAANLVDPTPIQIFKNIETIKTIILTGAQVAAIAATPLAKGGIVGRQVRGEQTAPIAGGDSVLTYLTPGEVVLNRRQQSLLPPGTLGAAGVPGFPPPLPAPSVLPARSGGGGGGSQQLEALLLQTNDLARTVAAKVSALEVVYTENTEEAIRSAKQDKLEIKERSAL